MAISTTVYPSTALLAVPLVWGNADFEAVVLDEGSFDRGTILYIDPVSKKARAWSSSETTTFNKEPFDVPEKQIELPVTVPEEFELKNAAGTVTYNLNSDYTVQDGVLTLKNGKDPAKEATLQAVWETAGDPDPVSHNESLTVPDIEINIAEQFAAGTEFSDFELWDKDGENEYTLTTDFTFTDGVLTIVSGGGAAGLSPLRISLTAEIPVTSAEGVLINSAGADDSRSAAVITRGKVYKNQVKNYSDDAAALLPDINFI